MNTRSFIKSILIASIAPSVLLPKLADHARWKRSNSMWVPNPEWESAEYEMIYLPSAYYGEWKFVTGDPGIEPPKVRFKRSDDTFALVPQSLSQLHKSALRS